MGIEPRTISKADALAEAYKRGLLPPDKKAAYEEAQRRGLVGGQPAAVAQPAAPQAASPAPVARPGAGFEMMPSSPQARRDMLGAQPPQPMAAVPGAQYSWTPPAELGDSQSVAAARTRMDAAAKAEADRVEAQAKATREAQLAAERREASRGYGAGMDMIISTDDQGQLRPGSSVDQDIGKGIITSPIRAANAAIGAGEALVNLYPDAINSVVQEFTSGPGMGKMVTDAVPRASIPRVPVPEGLDSNTGALLEGLGQFLIARKMVGSAAPGGGLAANIGKDALAVGVGYDGSTGRVADMFDVNAIPEGPLRDYAAWLQTQPDDSPIVGRFKNMLEDMTMSGPMLAPQGVVRAGQAVGNALTPKPMTPANAGGAGVQAAMAQSRAAPQPPPVARPAPPGAAQPQPSVSPVAQPTVPQGPARGAQPGATGAGQQAAGAVPPAGPATLQASPTAVPQPQNTASLARSDARIIRRLLVAGGVARNDVDRLLGDMVEAFNRSNDSRSRLAFFAEEYLPQQLPKEVADDVIQKLRGFGRERFGANSPRDPSRSIMRSNIGELRGSQREYLTDEFEGLLGKETLMNKQGKITRDKQGVAEAVYAEEIGRQQRLLADSLATPEQMAARDDLLLLMGREDFFKQVPAELHLKAADEGKSLWEFVHQNPLEAAHWMQSELGVLARKGNSIAQSMRMPLVRRLEDAVPGYRGARLEYGDLSGQQAALEFGDDLYRVAASKFDTDAKALEFKKLSPAQRTVAKKSIRDKLLNEFRKAKTGDQQAVVITAMQKDGVLDALETILGPDGKKVADAIRTMVRENEQLRAVDLLSGSNTADNLAQQQAAREAVRSPVNKAIGAVGDEGSYLQTGFADLVSVALGLPPVWTAGKVGTGLVGKLGSPSKKKLASATRTLYGSPPRNALNVEPPPPPSPRAPRGATTPRTPKPPVTQEDLDALLAQYDRTPTPAIRNKIIAARKALAPTGNKLATPKPPPANTGGKKPPQSNSPAFIGSALASGVGAGGITYAATGDEDLAMQVGIGAGLAGGVLGNRLSKMGGSKPKTVKPPPGAGGAKRADDFDTSTVFYHGTTNVFDEFNGPTWLSREREYAEEGFSWATPAEIANGTATPTVIEAHVRGRLKTIDDKAIEQLGYHPEQMEALKRQGYDGVQSSDQILIFDPKNIRRKSAASPPGAGGKPPPVGAKTAAPRVEPEAPLSSPYTQRPNPVGDMQEQTVGRAAAMRQLREAEAYRLKATDSEVVGLDEEIAALRDFLGLDPKAPTSRPPRPVAPPPKPQPQPVARRPEPEAPLASPYSARSNPAADMGDNLAGRANAQREIREIEAYRKTAPKSEWAALDEEINGLREFIGLPPKPAPPSKGPGGKPPPVQARKPGDGPGGIASRALVGGVIGAGVGSIAEGQTGDAQAQMAEVAAQMAKLQKTIDGLQAVLDIYDTGTPEQIQAAVARGGKYTKPDGVIGRETSAQVAADRARIAVEMKAALAELDKGRARVKQLEEQAAFDKTRPGMALQAARQAAPWIGALGGALGGAKMRGGAVSKATAEAVKREASVNALLTPGPIKTGRDAATRAAVKGQPANINEYWIRGGAGDKVPFEANAKGDWRMRPKGKVMPASKLFPDGKPGLRKNDLAWIATGLSEAGLSTLGVDAAHKELAAAQAAVENDKTEANYERLERAHDMVALAETMQRAGLGFAAGRLIGAYKTPYKSARPNVQNAEAEMARIAEYLQRLKK